MKGKSSLLEVFRKKGVLRNFEKIHRTPPGNSICIFATTRSSHQRCSAKNGALKNFAEITGKQLCQILF